MISQLTFASANIDERDVLPENIDFIRGKLLGDKGLIRPELTKELHERGIRLEHPVRENMREDRSESYLKSMKDKRRLVEMVIEQLTERFNIEKMRARKVWRAGIRFMRKILAHTIGMFINSILGRPLLQFEGLVG